MLYREICTSVRMYVCMYVLLYLCMCYCTYVCVNVLMYVCMYRYVRIEYICARMYLCMYVKISYTIFREIWSQTDEGTCCPHNAFFS